VQEEKDGKTALDEEPLILRESMKEGKWHRAEGTVEVEDRNESNEL